ncbi:hypothetical protein D9M68_770310 [compost metagenome]
MGAEVHVGAEHRRLAAALAQQVEKALQAGVALVELVIAQREGVEAHGVHQRRIGLTVGARAVEVQGAGERVARVQLQHVRRLGRQRLDRRGDARKARRIDRDRHRRAAARVELQCLVLGFEVRVVVVDVQDREVDRLALRRGRGGWCRRRRHGDRRERDTAAPTTAAGGHHAGCNHRGSCSHDPSTVVHHHLALRSC